MGDSGAIVAYGFIALMILMFVALIVADHNYQKKFPPIVVKGKNEKGEAEYTVKVRCMPTRTAEFALPPGTPIYAEFVFARTEGGSYVPRLGRRFQITGIILGILTICAIIFPILAGNAEIDIGYVIMIIIIELAILALYALVNMRHLIRAYRALWKYLGK